MTAPLRIGLVLDYTQGYPRGVLFGIRRFAETRPNWILVLHEASEFTSRTMQAMRPDGVIALVVDQKLSDILAKQQRPVVNVSFVLRDSAFPRVGVDNRQIGRLVVQHFADRGLRHFGFAGHPEYFYSLEREAGFRQALEELPDGYDSCACYHELPGRSYRERGRLLALSSGLQRWLRGLPKPVGVFAYHDLWGVQLIEACRLTGLRVPEDVAVIGVDNDDLLCRLSRPALSSIIIPGERVGWEAAAILDRLLQGKKPAPPAILIPPVGVVTRRSSEVLPSSDEELVAAVRFIADHARSPLQVSDLLRELSASRRSLEQKFRSVLRHGIAEEMRRVHVELAKDLLVTTSLSIAEVAEQSGFTSAQALSRIFRKEMGCTPGAFREQARFGTNHRAHD
jgi:LacI family transcriptional regulator